MLSSEALALRHEIEGGIQAHGIVAHPAHGPISADEMDGLGHQLLMADANVPSLLSLPYLGYRDAEDPLYVKPRRLVLSHDNPRFARGRYAASIASPQTPPGMVWPIALILQGLPPPQT